MQNASFKQKPKQKNKLNDQHKDYHFIHPCPSEEKQNKKTQHNSHTIWSSHKLLDQPSVSSVAQSCPTLCDTMDCTTSGLPVLHQFQSLLKLMSIESVMPSNRLILCRPLLLLPSIFSCIRVFSNESGGQRIGVSASASALPMNIQDWFPLGSPYSSRGSQEPSPTSQFKSINSLTLSLPYSPLTIFILDLLKELFQVYLKMFALHHSSAQIKSKIQVK